MSHPPLPLLPGRFRSPIGMVLCWVLMAVLFPLVLWASGLTLLKAHVVGWGLLAGIGVAGAMVRERSTIQEDAPLSLGGQEATAVDEGTDPLVHLGRGIIPAPSRWNPMKALEPPSDFAFL